MTARILGVVICVGLVMAAVAVAQQRGDGFMPPRAPANAGPAITAGSELIVAPMTLGDKTQVLTVVDPRQRVICVYHIDAVTGRIGLKSARKIQWDLQISDLNNDKPLPQEIESFLQK